MRTLDNNTIVLKDTKMGYFREIYSLTLKQKEALDTEDLDLLEELISAKQVCMDKIDQLQVEWSQHEERYPEFLEIDHQEVVADIIKVDNLNKQIAAGIFQAIKEKVGQVRQGKKMHNAYNPNLTNSAFINKAR